MNNYVLMYYLEDKAAHLQFEEKIKNEFKRYKIDESNSIKYFGFAAREQPEVVDRLNTMLSRFGIGTKDFVALFYSKNENPETIKRLMLVGHDNLIETRIKNISIDAHRNSLTNLLNFDYVKGKSISS